MVSFQSFSCAPPFFFVGASNTSTEERTFMEKQNVSPQPFHDIHEILTCQWLATVHPVDLSSKQRFQAKWFYKESTARAPYMHDSEGPFDLNHKNGSSLDAGSFNRKK